MSKAARRDAHGCNGSRNEPACAGGAAREMAALGGGGGDQLNELGWVLEITFTIASPSPQAGPDRGGWDGVALGRPRAREHLEPGQLGVAQLAQILMTLGDERAVRATYVLGELAYTPP